MEKLGIFLDKSITLKYSPVFEIIHSVEIILIVTGILLSFPLLWIIYRAEPLHRNLRIILVACVLEVVVIFLTRPALIYLQFCDVKDPSFLIPFAVARIQSFIFWAFIMTGITFERLIATFYWEWYEKQSGSTLIIAVGALLATGVFVSWNTLQIIGVYRTESIFAIREVGSPLAAGFTLLSCVLYVVLLIFNKYELRKLHQGCVSEYSLAHIYQLRENVVMMEMLLRMLGPAFVLCFPAFAFRAVHIFLPATEAFEFPRSLSLSIFDAWISLVSTIMVFIFPFFNARFRKPAAKVVCYRRIVRCFNRRMHTSRVSAEREMIDLYFESLNRALDKPKPRPAKGFAKYLKHSV